MNRFVYLADTHIGTELPGYFMQPPHPGRIAEILAALRRWIDEIGGVDFILHGGDMTDSGSEENIRTAAALFRQMQAPVYLCLGNHDLTESQSLQNWLALYPEAFPGGGPEFSLAMEHGGIHVMPNHWRDTPYYWEPGDNSPAWMPGQWEALEARYPSQPRQTQLLVTHAPVLGVPPEQTGMSEPYHPSSETFVEPLVTWVDRHPEIVAVLGAHSHINMRVERRERLGTHYVTASSMSEAPFEFKFFGAGPHGLSMRTIALGERVGFDGGYDPSHAFVQGREEDRAFSTLC